MFETVCPVCKNKFYSENKSLTQDVTLHNFCVPNKKWETQQSRPQRTSTPISELESTPSTSLSDSVADFFYQSWKSGLGSVDSKFVQGSTVQPQMVLQTEYQPPQVVYVNTVIFQSYMTTQYVPQYVPVGYRPDGTYGVLHPYSAYYNYHY